MDETWLTYAAIAVIVILLLIGSVVRRVRPAPTETELVSSWVDPRAARIMIEGRAAVRTIFRVRDGDLIAGCLVMDGEFREGTSVRVVRGGKILGPPTSEPGVIGKVRRHKELLASATAGMECGVQLFNVAAVFAGDVLEAYRVEQMP